MKISIVDSPSSEALDFKESSVVDGAVSLLHGSAEKSLRGNRKKRGITRNNSADTRETQLASSYPFSVSSLWCGDSCVFSLK
jgi:hypothetical protein